MGETDAAAAGDLVARDQYLLSGADQAGALLPRRHDAAERPGGDRLLSRDRHLHGRLPGGGGRGRRRGGGAGLRQRAAERAGGQRRLRDVLPHDHRCGGEGRLRCAVARPARRHGHRAVRRWRGRTAAPHPRHRSDARRSASPTTCTPTFFDAMVEQRAGRHRLSDLSAYRPAADRGTRGARAAARDARRGAADRRLGCRADAAARDGAGHASRAQQGPAGDVRGVGGERPGAGRQPVRRLPACRCRDGGTVGRGGHRQRSGTTRRRWWTN